MFTKQKAFARENIVLNSVQHVAAGFGLAVLFQEYLVGNSFVHAIVGWLLLTFSVVINIYGFVRRSSTGPT